MRFRVFIFSAVLIVGTQSLKAQDFGFLGKKNVVTFFSTSSFRILSAVGLEDFPLLEQNAGLNVVKYTDANQEKTRNRLMRYDLRLGYARQLNRRIALGAEFSYEKLHMTRPTLQTRWSTPVFNNFGGMLTLTFTPKNKIAPMGYSSTVGFGPKVYKFSFNQNYRFDSQNPMNEPFPRYQKSMVGINAYWQHSVRIMVTRFMLIEVGLRLQTGYVFRNGDQLEDGTVQLGTPYENKYNSNLDQTEYPNMKDVTIWDKGDLLREVRGEALGNLATFKLGIGFLF